MSATKLRQLLKAASPGPWASAESGYFDSENFVEKWQAIMPKGKEPEDCYAEVEHEIARVGVARWRNGIRFRSQDAEEDEANAKLLAAAPALARLVLELKTALTTVMALLEAEQEPPTGATLQATIAAHAALAAVEEL